MRRRRFLTLAAATPLAGCGWHAVYAPGGHSAAGPVGPELAAVYVALIPERYGQLLRQALQQRVEGTGLGVPKRYELLAGPGLSIETQGIQRDSSSSRVRVIGTAQWTLRDMTPARALVTSGSARALDGYNILNQQFFAAELEGDAATRRIASALADQITQQMATFFSNRTG